MNIKQPVAKPKTGSRAKTQVRTKDGTYSTKLTRKQKAFADEYIRDTKAPNSDIVKRTYNITDTHTASQMARQNLNKPEIQLYIQEHINKAKEKIVELVDSDKEEIAFRASVDILDRTTGKAIQRTEQVSTGVTLNIDLSGTGVSEDAVTDRDTL